MESYALSTLAGYDVDGAAFAARELVAEHVVGADLVLGATREHRAAAVVLHPRAAARTFTLREFARLAGAVDPATLPDGDPVERARALVRPPPPTAVWSHPTAPGTTTSTTPTRRRRPPSPPAAPSSTRRSRDPWTFSAPEPAGRRVAAMPAESTAHMTSTP